MKTILTKSSKQMSKVFNYNNIRKSKLELLTKKNP